MKYLPLLFLAFTLCMSACSNSSKEAKETSDKPVITEDTSTLFDKANESKDKDAEKSAKKSAEGQEEPEGEEQESGGIEDVPENVMAVARGMCDAMMNSDIKAILELSHPAALEHFASIADGIPEGRDPIEFIVESFQAEADMFSVTSCEVTQLYENECGDYEIEGLGSLGYEVETCYNLDMQQAGTKEDKHKEVESFDENNKETIVIVDGEAYLSAF